MREGGGGEVGLCSSSDRFRDNSGPLSLIQQATRMARRTGKAPKRKGTPTKCWFCEKTDGEREGEREREIKSIKFPVLTSKPLLCIYTHL